MSGELFIPSGTGLSVYGHVKNATSQRWNGSAFETYIGSNYGTYTNWLTEQGASGMYAGDFPVSIITAGHYEVIYYSADTPGVSTQGDRVIGVGSIDWSGVTVVETLPGLVSTTVGSELLLPNISGLIVYAQIKNTHSRRWNNTQFGQFEAYNSGNYSAYSIPTVEQGTSGAYVADFPVANITPGHYEILYFSQQGGSPAERDPIIGTGAIDWTGSRLATEPPTISGAMSGSDWYAYVLRALKRPDKQTEVFDATKDTIDNMRLRIIFPEDETDGEITDQIITLGDYRMDLEGDFGHCLSAIVLIDVNFGYTLRQVSKDEYDRCYTGFGTSTSSRGRPKVFCIYGQRIIVGPVPDKTTYLYKISYARDDHNSYTLTSLSIPFTNKYREIERWGTLQRVYSDILKNDDQAAKFGTLYEDGLKKIEMRLDRNRVGVIKTRYRGI